MKNTPKIVVKQNEETPVPAEVIAQSIVEIAAGMNKLNATRLTRRALVVLIHDHSKIPMGTVMDVLNSLDELETTYLKAKPKK